MVSLKKNKYRALILDNPKKAFFVISFPIVIGMFMNTLYNIVDTIYVGQLGEVPLAALTFTFPLFFIAIAINSGLGAGVNSRIARFIGEDNKAQAENTAMHGLFISLFLAIIVFVLGMLFIGPILSLFGADGQVLLLARDYMYIIVSGVFFLFPLAILSNIMSSQGITSFEMIFQTLGLLLNLVLDPLLIYYFDMGVRGAALATIIVFLVLLIFGSFYLKRKSALHLGFDKFKFDKSIVKDIFNVGAPSSVTMFFMSSFFLILNKIISDFGINYIASIAVIARIESLVLLPVVGFSIALMTIVGTLKGAGMKDKLNEIARFGLKFNFFVTFVLSLGLFFISRYLFMLFTQHQSVIDVGVPYLMVDLFGIPIVAVAMTSSRIMQGTGYGLPGFVINVSRMFLLRLPLILSLVYIFNYGFLSIAYGLLVGDILAAIIAYIWLEWHLKCI